jgi:hypothetical protein
MAKEKVAREKKGGGFFSLFLIVLSLAAAIFFGIMYYSQKINFDESRKMLSETKNGYGAILSEISDLRLRLNATESENKNFKERAVAAEAKTQTMGKVKGVLSHQKNPLPLGLLACAETKTGDNLFCINHDSDGAYELELPAGEYYIFALDSCYPPINNGRLSACPSNVAFYTEFVKCNPAEPDNQCPHDKAVVKVDAGVTLDNINPSDWFKEKK